MPQNPLGPRLGGNSAHLNVTAPTVIKASPGTVFHVNVITAPSAAGGVYDIDTTGAAATANQIAVVPTAVGTLDLTFPCFTGIVVDPGTAGVVSVSYS